jgi:hypothetical protein
MNPEIRATTSVLAAVMLCALLGACQGRGHSGVVRIVPNAQGEAESPAPASLPSTRTSPGNAGPRVSIDPQYTVLQVLNVNLDQDADEEQVIAVKRITDMGSPVRLLVVDADPMRGTYYFQSWDTDTSATDSRVFSLAAKDLIGDHSLQIVASGMNEVGKLTLDVFRQQPPSQGKGLIYKPVCQLVADEINVDESERPDSYTTDPKQGAAFPVIAYLRDPDSQNVMDLVRIRYAWSAAAARYVPGAAEKIPGEEVQQAQLRTLFTAPGEQAFEQFISGSWVQAQVSTSPKARDAYFSIIDFDPLRRKISISSGNTQEAYLWSESYRTIYNSLRAIGQNETVLNIQLIRTFFITVNDPNTITVTIIGNDSGDSPSATYTRVNDEIRQKLIDRPDTQAILSPLSLLGRYSGRQGLSIDFQSPHVTWTDNVRQRTGTYVLFSLAGGTILTTRFRSETGEPDQINSWLVDYKEKRDSSTTTRTLGLSPIQLTVNGFEEANGDDLSVQQVQDLKKK